nr:hypothetical protein [Mycoplasmopsis bovis]
MINNKKVEKKRIIQRFKLHCMLIDWLILIGLDNAYKIFRLHTAVFEGDDILERLHSN